MVFRRWAALCCGSVATRIHGFWYMQATASLLAASSSAEQEPAHVQELRRQLADQQRLVNELLTNGRPRGTRRTTISP